MTKMEDYNQAVRDALTQLDGTSKSAVLLLTGLNEDGLAELGGMPEYFCTCEQFKLWYIDETTKVKVCFCGHPSLQHLDDTKMCVGDVTKSK